MRRLRNALIGCALVATLVCSAVYIQVQSWGESPVTLPAEVVVSFEPGTSLTHLARDLSSSGVIDNESFFSLYVRVVRRNYRSFQSGTYRFDGQVTPAFIVEKITKGESYHPIVLTIAVPEGFTLKALIDRLAAHGVGSHPQLRSLVRDASFLKRLRVPGQTLEGYIYPATYTFYSLPRPEDALSEMVKTFWQNLPSDYEKNIAKKGLSLHQAVTFASLIELETQTDEERPLVSEVIWRRLKDKAPLGIDAALIYGIPDYAGDLKWSHLSDATNPYNTRIRKGLPPGPIGAPSRKSLEAVLTPANAGHYYYVLKAGTTRHTFSRTLAEHNLHVKELVAALRAKSHDHAKKDRSDGPQHDQGDQKGSKGRPQVSAKDDAQPNDSLSTSGKIRQTSRDKPENKPAATDNHGHKPKNP